MNKENHSSLAGSARDQRLPKLSRVHFPDNSICLPELWIWDLVWYKKSFLLRSNIHTLISLCISLDPFMFQYVIHCIVFIACSLDITLKGHKKPLADQRLQAKHSWKYRQLFSFLNLLYLKFWLNCPNIVQTLTSKELVYLRLPNLIDTTLLKILKSMWGTTFVASPNFSEPTAPSWPRRQLFQINCNGEDGRRASEETALR